MAKHRFILHGSNAHTPALTGGEADISKLCKYGGWWYEWCYYREQGARFPFEVLDRFLGPATGAGNEMAQWVLKAKGNFVPRRSLCPLQVCEDHSPEEKE